MSDLKRWISEEAGVLEGSQILMTANGKNVKQQHLVLGSEIFVYSRELLSKESLEVPEHHQTTEIDELDRPPQEPQGEPSIEEWQGLFKSRRVWAQGALESATAVSSVIRRIVDTCETIDRATMVAYKNLRNHVDSIMQIYDRTRRWASDCLAEHETLLQEWDTNAEKMKNLSVRRDLAGLLNTTVPLPPGAIYMTDLVRLDKCALDLHNLREEDEVFRTSIENLTQQVKDLQCSTEDAARLTQVIWPDCETQADVQEIEALLLQISSDNDEILSIPSGQKSIARISRLVAAHTDDYIPAIQHALAACVGASKTYHTFENEIRMKSHQTLRKISAVQSHLGSLHHALSGLSLSALGQTSLGNLDRALHMPSAYGSLLIEAVRRSEWWQMTRRDVDTVQAGLAQQRQEELTARERWTFSIQPYLSVKPTNSQSITASGPVIDSQDWPKMERSEAFDYINRLVQLEIHQAAEHVTSLLEALEVTNNHHSGRLGSTHNEPDDGPGLVAAIAEGSEMQALRGDKSRLEERLRTSESRVRKLEDLVHRQEQSSRGTQGDFASCTEAQRFNELSLSSEVAQPLQGGLSLPKVASERADTKRMAHRISTLKAHVEQLRQVAEQERRLGTASRERMEEAEAVKHDLLANFETHRQEFDDERRKLEEDNQELKNRLEALEEELDHLTGSRDHERDKHEQVMTNLRYELERLRKTSHEEINAMQTTRESLEHDLTVQADKLTRLEALLDKQKSLSTAAHIESEQHELRWQQLQAQHQRYIATLQAAHNHLSPAGSPPESLDRLTNALEVLAEGTVFHARGLDNALQTTNERVKASEDQVVKLDAKMNEIRKRNERLTEDLSRKDQQVSEVVLQRDGLRMELLAKSGELSTLHERIATGTSGSEALKEKLQEVETALQRLTDKVAAYSADNESLRAELTAKDIEICQSAEKNVMLQAALSGRASRIKDLSERLFHNNDRMIRILENFGYVVSRQDDDTLLVQRASKANASMILSADVSIPIRRTVSSTAPMPHYYSDNDLARMNWLDPDDDQNEEQKYRSFLAVLDRLDADSTVDTITKRYKDVEALAKKYQKDSRALKERNHRLQSDAHDKIAYRAFKEGDLALFLPTRNQVTRSWAAFNVGAPHYFLHEQDTHKLQSKEWLLARIHKIDERIVDLSKSSNNGRLGASTSADAGDAGSIRSVDDENPFELSDGLRWYLIEAVEEKAGAPSTPGLSKTTVAASVVDVQAQMGTNRTADRVSGSATGPVNAAKTLHKSLDSRRSSEASRKGGLGPLRPSVSHSSAAAALGNMSITGPVMDQTSPAAKVKPSDSHGRDQSVGQVRADATVFEVVRQDLLLGS